MINKIKSHPVLVMLVVIFLLPVPFVIYVGCRSGNQSQTATTVPLLELKDIKPYIIRVIKQDEIMFVKATSYGAGIGYDFSENVAEGIGELSKTFDILDVKFTTSKFGEASPTIGALITVKRK